MLTIALIDNHPIIRTGLGLFLKNKLEDVTLLEADTIASFQELFPSAVPDLIILGVSQTSELSSVKLITVTKNSYPLSKIIVFDENPESQIILRYLRAGANGYLTKFDDLNDLVDCIRDVIKGRRYLCNEVISMLLDKHPLEKKIPEKIKKSNLTSRESEIAKYLSDGMRTSMIAQKLGKKASTISTIKNHIFRKLEVDNVLKLRDVFFSQSTNVSVK